MEDQGKRLLLAVVLALGVVVLWQFIFPAEKPKPKKEKPPTSEVENLVPENDSPVGLPKDNSPAPVAAPMPAEPPIVLEYDNLHVEFSSRNGVLSSYRLTEPKYRRAPDKGQLVADPKRGIFGVNFNKMSDVVIPRDSVWHGEKLEDGAVKFTYRQPGVIEVVKTFRVHPEAYLVEMELSVQNLGEAALTQSPVISAVGASRGSKKTNANCLLNGDIRARSQEALRGGDTRKMHGKVQWIAFNHPYLFTAIAPRDRDDDQSCYLHPVEGLNGGMQVDLVYPQQQMQKTMWKTAVVGYIGPKFLDKLEGANGFEYNEFQDETSFEPGFDASVSMGWFSFIARPLLWVLTWLHGFTGNWGIAIILLTVLVKLATLYWTTKSMRSMKAMSALKPQMDELQKKYPDDRARLQQEMMALYKQHGVSPLAGCLPMLLQMPIWLALYRMLSSVGELYLAPFIPGWIDDLTSTDPYHVLPIAVMAMMFLQSRLSPASLDSMQQKILMYGLPLMFGVMSFFFPSGLSIYILTNTTLSMLHTLYMKKFDRSAKSPLPMKKPVAAAAAAPERTKRSSAAPKVIDVEAEEEVDESSEDEASDDEEEAAPSKAAAQAPRGNKTQPRRKRKRGRH